MFCELDINTCKLSCHGSGGACRCITYSSYKPATFLFLISNFSALLLKQVLPLKEKIHISIGEGGTGFQLTAADKRSRMEAMLAQLGLKAAPGCPVARK